MLERISRESAMRRSESQFRRLLEKLPAGAYTCDAEGLISYFNQHAVQLWGRAPKLNDPVDRFCGSFKLFSVDGTPLAHAECWMALALKMNKEFNGHEIIIERPDGTRITALAHANPFHDESGTLLGAVNVLVDITERKRAEDILKQADRAKNEFLATLAHELRNPLAPISNAAQILRLNGLPVPESQWALGVIDREIQHMSRLIDDLLDVARITNNRLELRKERIELKTILHKAVETSRPVIEAGGQEFAADLPPQPLFVDGDLTRLAQVVANLLNNAVKYTPRGGRIWLETEQKGGAALVRVRDTGIGISPDMKSKIFEMFSQGECASERSKEGLGIGLTLARRLVEMHGGTVEAHSAGIGHGSTFVVCLPVAAEVKNPEPQRQSVGEAPFKTPSGRRILVVDDHKVSAKSLATLLRTMGNEVEIANDGLEAVEAAAVFQPEVIFLDIGMPKLNGYEAARQIREQQRGDGIVLIALTGWGQEEDRCRSKEAGFDHHLTKPVKFDALDKLLAKP